jgi:hypothetical protein
MLFTLRDIAGRMEPIFRAWFDRQESLGPVLVRYFHLVHTPPSSREHEFESLVRVLETHHRRTTVGAVGTPEHEKRLEAILSSVPEEHRGWLEEELEFSHEPPLRQRLKDTLGRCPTITKRLIGNSKAKDSFIWKVVRTRNFETYLDPRYEADAAQGAALVTLIHQLRALVEMTLLLEIGFTCEEVAQIFDRSSDRFRLIDHLRGLS